MGRRPFIVLLVFCLLWLAACGADAPEVLPTATAVPPQPTTTATQPPTALPSPTMGVTETAAPTPTETPPSPLAHISDLTKLPAIPIDNSKTYNLKHPSYEFLRDWLQAARETPISILPKYYILDLLAFDFARSFPEGAGSLDPIFQEDIYHGAYLDDGVTWPLLETAVVAHLNQNQIRFEAENPINISSGITLEPKAVDLGGDGVREWMVKVKSDDLHILGVIPLTINQSDQFAILPNTIEPINTSLFFDKAEVGFDFDFTGDGNHDILQVQQGYLGGPTGYINIYTWNGSGLYLLEMIDITAGTHRPFPAFEISDFTGDGVMDVKVTTSHELNFDCDWDEEDVYSWRGSSPQHVLMDDLPPDTPECAMFHAITPQRYYSEAVLAEKSRTELLEEALNRLSLESAPSADYLALGYLHLAMAHAVQGDHAAAAAAFAHINTLPADSPFVKLVTDLYLEENSDLAALCQRLYSEPELAEKTDISPYIHAGSITGYFGPGSEAFNQLAICRYPSFEPKPVDEVFPQIPSNQSESNPPTWQSLLYDVTGKFEWEWMNELQTAVLTQSDPDIASKITDLLAYLPTDDPEAQPYIEHLTYLLGYHYELSGDDETAVTTYLSLIRQAPNSPWSWLAWARLEPAAQ